MSKLKTVNGNELFDMDIHPPEFIVSEIMPVGLHILAGSPKIGKSWLVLWLCDQIAKGEKIWEYDTQKSGVLYLALEDTYNRLHHRLTSITEISSDNINLAIESYSLEQGLLSQLREYMFENNNIKLIVIDTFQQIRNAEDKQQIWTADMVKIALDNMDDKILHLGLHLCFVCSLRPGEALGLTWNCVNFGEGFIEITKTLQRAPIEAIQTLPKDSIFSILPSKTPDSKSRYILKIPKTETSNRKIFISEQLKSELVERYKTIENEKDIFKEIYEDNNLVFALEDGSPIEVNLLNKWFKKWLQRSGYDFPAISIGNIRHSSLTYKLPLYNGDIKSLQSDSGHARADVLLRVYAQKQDAHRKKLVKTLEDDFYSDSSKKTGTIIDSDVLLNQMKNDPELQKKVLTALLAQVADNQNVI